MRVKLDPEKAADAQVTIGFKFTDIDEGNALEIRKGVAVFHGELPEETDATFVGTKDLLDRILIGETNVAQALADGELTIDGDKAAAEAFFGYFDPPDQGPIKLIVR